MDRPAFLGRLSRRSMLEPVSSRLKQANECAAWQEDDARWFFQQLIVGLDYCHKMGVVNRDIKLENTLLDGSPKPLVKITDFGYCKSDKESLPKSKVGTPGYTGKAPQLRHWGLGFSPTAQRRLWWRQCLILRSQRCPACSRYTLLVRLAGTYCIQCLARAFPADAHDHAPSNAA